MDEPLYGLTPESFDYLATDCYYVHSKALNKPHVDWALITEEDRKAWYQVALMINQKIANSNKYWHKQGVNHAVSNRE